MDKAKEILVVDSCINLMEILYKNDSNGFELDIKTPKCIAHCNFHLQ